MAEQEIAFIPIPILIGASLVLLGVLGMLIANHFKEKRLAPFLKGDELSEEWLKNASLTHSLREVGVGLLITLVTPIFVHFILVGTARDAAAVIVGYLAAVLCSLGSFSRQQHDLDSLGIGTDAKTIQRTLVVFALFLMILLWGALTLYSAFFRFVQTL